MFFLIITHDKELHLLCKTRLIQTYILATGSYGAELIAMGQKRTCKIQASETQLTSTLYGVGYKSLLTTPKNLLKDLISSPANNKTGKTWVQSTKMNLDILVKGAEIIDDKWTVDDNILYRVSCIKSMRDLELALHPPALKPEGNKERVTQEQRAERQLRDSIHTYLLHCEFERESKSNNKVRLYDLYSFGQTANFIATSIHVPCVRRGITYLSRLQMGALPTTKERIQTMKALHKDCDLTEYTCPFCNQFFEGEECCHYILNWKASEKEQCLLRELYPETSQAIGDNDEDPYMETAYGSHDLIGWVNGYRHIPHIYPKDEEHGYVAISAYLQEIVPQIEKRLYREAKQSEDDSSLPVSNTGNPMIRTNESPLMGSTCPYTSTQA
ncbi:hypothetical protein VP01_1075g5 [Puccinia sorghi]|uniref:Uncharacterized protein n=1 Tax=Puccinia sorghi TaxID=27349 RepID=A0A0L6VTS4_9BASI|nr:hypothetical protein VP01_1075g5 [Puccinia sorghi]